MQPRYHTFAAPVFRHRRRLAVDRTKSAHLYLYLPFTFRTLYFWGFIKLIKRKKVSVLNVLTVCPFRWDNTHFM